MIIKRDEYLNQIKPFMDTNIIKVITGIRRCGKSTLMLQLIEEIKSNGVNLENIIHLNFESIQYQDIDLFNFVLNKISDKTEKYYLLFDEIQNIDGWEKIISSFMVDFNVDIYITGSNSKLLSGELATHIVGRYVEIKIYPFSFRELLQLKILENNLNFNLNDKKEKLMYNTFKDKVFNDFFENGGMPAIFEIKNKNHQLIYLEDIFNTIILKDIVSRYDIRKIDILNRIVLYICENIGNTFSAKKISNYFKNQKRNIYPEIISNYLYYLENSCLIHKVNRVDLKGKKILTIHEKYYLTDHGFNRLFFSNNEDKILENIVYIELLRQNFDVKIAKLNDLEIDFIAIKNNKKLYIQVSYTINDENTRKRELRPFYKINDNFPKYIITTDKVDFSCDGIIHLNIIDFLINLL